MCDLSRPHWKIATPFPPPNQASTSVSRLCICISNTSSNRWNGRSRHLLSDTYLPSIYGSDGCHKVFSVVALPILWLSCSLAAFLASAASKVCFDHNGNQLTTDDALPCEPDSKSDGPCCAPGTICLSNGLCKSPNTRVNNWYDTYKPTCTDGTWTTENCFDGCNGCEWDYSWSVLSIELRRPSR
jgi:hypothetical protein